MSSANVLHLPNVSAANPLQVCLGGMRHHFCPSSPPLTQVTVNKKELGTAFKKDAKSVEEALQGLPECDALELKVGGVAGGGGGGGKGVTLGGGREAHWLWCAWWLGMRPRLHWPA
jgi:hypothetical protein